MQSMKLVIGDVAKSLFAVPEDFLPYMLTSVIEEHLEDMCVFFSTIKMRFEQVSDS